MYQRPQHLLSRLARTRRIYFIEEPVLDEAQEAYLERFDRAENVVVYRPHTPVDASGFGDEQMPTLKKLVSCLVEDERLMDYMVWMYTPMALPVAQILRPVAIVYDCMDALSAFLQAPPQLIERETHLLQWADVVFTGGPSLYRAKQGKHPNLHCFPSSVDAEHFRQVSALPDPQDQADIPHPRLGYFGVIDERMDLGVLGALAEAHPDWQIVMVGPVVKINESDLPRKANIHYMGQRRYEELPAYLGGWDVCLLPFARNEATRFVSPTKTLEYMAAELPIVSTPITDVAEPYGDIVYLGDTREAFIKACEQALTASPQERAARTEKIRGVLRRTSWDSTAQAMERLISEVERQKSGAGEEVVSRTTAPERSSAA